MKLKVGGSFVLVAALIAALGLSSGGGDGGTCVFPTCFPSASTTGVPAGTTLTAYTGPGEVTTDDTVIDGKNVDCITIRANNVTIRNSHVSCEDFLAINCLDTCGTVDAPITIEDTEIDCTGFGASGLVGQGTGIWYQHLRIRRVNIHGCENGLSIGDDVLIEDSFIHGLYNDLAVPPPDGAHADGIQFGEAHHLPDGTSVPGAKDITIRHNTIEGGGWPNSATSTSDPFTLGTSSIITNRPVNGIDENILIEKNLLGGGGVGVYCEQFDTPAINERVINNHFSNAYGAYGSGIPFVSSDCYDEADISGNVIHETNAPVALE